MGADAHAKTDQAMPAIAYDKNAVLQEAKVFSKVPINSKKCIAAITKILYLITKGKETLTEVESTEVFFGATRLFESNDERLRRLVYLLIKSIKASETEIFIVTSSLTKDVNSSNHIYRANAIRAMCLVVKSNVASQVERYIKSSLVDNDQYVCSSALLCCIRIFTQMPQAVRRWVSEASTCLNNTNKMVQFHGTLMMCLVRLNDKQSLRKLVTNVSKSGMGQHTECFIIRFVAANFHIMESECVEIVNAGLKHSNDAVRLEALKAIVTLALNHYKRNGGMKGFVFDMRDVITMLQTMLSSKDHTIVYAAMRQVYQIAQTLPLMISVLNGKIEEMLKRKNKDLSSMALLTLLQTGGAETIERLLQQANSLSGDFKRAVAKALKGLCVSFPDKHPIVLKFFANNLRVKASRSFKSEMIDATMHIVERIPEAQAQGLKNLCDYIEDCGYPDLNAKVLKFLGETVPKSQTPEEYVRYIYNRLLLENATVRAAGIEALDNIVHECPSLKSSVSVLLLPTLKDPEEELRERVNLTYALMLVDERVEINNLPMASTVDFKEFETKVKNSNTFKQLADVVYDVTETFNMDALSRCLQECIENNNGYDQIDEMMQQAAVAGNMDEGTQTTQAYGEYKPEADVLSHVDVIGQEATVKPNLTVLPPEILQMVPDNVTLITSSNVHLTDEEEDYSVEAIVHASQEALVLEFIIGNTLPDQVLENVAVSLDYSTCHNAGKWNIKDAVPIPSLSLSEEKSAYVVLTSHNQDELPHLGLLMGMVKVDFTFDVKCRTGSSRSYRDSYSANDLHLGIGIYCSEWSIPETDFDESWNRIDKTEESATFGLQFKDLQEAVEWMRKFFGNSLVMQPKGNIDRIATLNVAGKLLNKYNFLAKATIAQGDTQAIAQPNLRKGCILRLQIKTEVDDLPKIVFALLE
ncbi:Adaptin N terminal region family protein [Babesia bovis T2Bo]|uniref:Coatomer subunit gamma n=1 Tax=Babesia bovis TaxID=5865 RepID=A7ATJ0_BABBO|nr:Adaptin N terminal region family protein [Babesia bovis T2Bo]EDO06251.1 Adaptin N terminal region family protein [Babesia bovis T2Bo]|eukprot:XP_001609819.1 adaptin N terminal region family protein [Babesia bovis T2Bo]